MKKRPKLILASIELITLLTFAIFVWSIFVTNPTKLGPGGVTFWFINLLFMICGFLTLVLYFLRRRKSLSDLKLKELNNSIRSGTLLGLSLTILVALSSLRSLSWRDIILFLLLIILVEVFFRTRKET